MTAKKDDSGATEGMDDSLLDPRGKANLEKAREMQDMRDETNAVADEQDGGPLKRLDGFGSNRSTAIRDIVLAQPICPKSQIRGKIVAGQYEPPEIGPDDGNCQRAGKGWWNLCSDKGHNPYWRSVRVYHTVDVTETDPETGEEWVVDTRKKVVKADKLNATRVSPQISHNSGIGIGIKMRDHGFRRISDFGYAEVCQFGGCQNIPTMRCQYGDYCSEAHMNLVAAKEEGVFLANHPTGTFDAEDQKKIERFREKQLREVAPRNVQRIQNG